MKYFLVLFQEESLMYNDEPIEDKKMKKILLSVIYNSGNKYKLKSSKKVLLKSEEKLLIAFLTFST